eukprot:Lithocolla_globosa_v1_NODE_91_length_6522_cov_117.886655.p1 type:complete len:715 gc:universal NODE_91_length_6522_cov_117.886655:127-2271(+)
MRNGKSGNKKLRLIMVYDHLFNIKENENYVGEYPKMDDYCHISMKPDDRTKFIEWYEKQKGSVFDMKKEITEYCISDVDILKRGIMKFRENFLSITDDKIDPFKFITIASVCINIYKYFYMPENKLGISEPTNKTLCSNKSIAWLNSLNNNRIKHGMNGMIRLKNGKKISVDGFDRKTNTVYEFFGCFWHGCNKCYKGTEKNNKSKKKMCDLYNETVNRNSIIKNSGFNLITMWEHDFKGELKDVDKNIDPRDAMFGGRTETFWLKYITKPDEWIEYLDITSLYPSVMYYDRYPVGHPIRITKDFEGIENYFGKVKCIVKCPKTLLFPVLPVRDDDTGKLTFSLGDDKNEITGTWCTPELNKAIEMGYEIIEIYEVLHFEKTSKKLFKKHVSQFLKLKQEASGYPTGCDTDERKNNYIKEYEKCMGIKLDKDNIKYNAGMRAVAKLCLNSLWGKFIQRLNQVQKKFVSNTCEFYDLIFDKTKNIGLINIINDECIEVSFCNKNEFVESTNNTNVYVGCFTTAHARMRLYTELQLLGDRALYCDTDSIIYVGRKGEYCIPTGENLGEWKDEFDGSHAIKFLSTGPKSYYYKLNECPKSCKKCKGLDSECSNLEECKIKGFTLNHENSVKLNGNGLEQIIDGVVDKITITNHMITRNNRKLITKDIDKDFQFSSTKREYLKDFSSIPWGYKIVDDDDDDWSDGYEIKMIEGNIFKT